MADPRLHVLGERAVDREAGVLAVQTACTCGQWMTSVICGYMRTGAGGLTLLEAFPAGLAVQAGVGKPLDADTVADLDGRVLRVLADSDDAADTLCARGEIMGA